MSRMYQTLHKTNPNIDTKPTPNLQLLTDLKGGMHVETLEVHRQGMD